MAAAASFMRSMHSCFDRNLLLRATSHRAITLSRLGKSLHTISHHSTRCRRTSGSSCRTCSEKRCVAMSDTSQHPSSPNLSCFTTPSRLPANWLSMPVQNVSASEKEMVIGSAAALVRRLGRRLSAARCSAICRCRGSILSTPASSASCTFVDLAKGSAPGTSPSRVQPPLALRWGERSTDFDLSTFSSSRMLATGALRGRRDAGSLDLPFFHARWHSCVSP
mmetsp:Transcript_47302/g.90293  ORF Transcript_47302/g.90293 Transcript_47302/m.90293 type:complete len:222 (-) Transcript_47302:815-1480(-)